MGQDAGIRHFRCKWKNQKMRYSIFYKPVYKHKKAIEDNKIQFFDWRWIGRDFVSVRSAKRFAKINKIFIYSIFSNGSNKLSDALYNQGASIINNFE